MYNTYKTKNLVSKYCDAHIESYKSHTELLIRQKNIKNHLPIMPYGRYYDITDTGGLVSKHRCTLSHQHGDN